MRVLVTFTNVSHELGAGKQGYFYVTLSIHFYATKTAFDSINCGERCLMVTHNPHCSAGAGCCGTVPFSPQRPSCHVHFEKDITSCLDLLERRKK